MKDEKYWENRYREAEKAFQVWKSMTKRFDATFWTPEYRELANSIHSLGRDVFYVKTELCYCREYPEYGDACLLLKGHNGPHDWSK